MNKRAALFFVLSCIAIHLQKPLARAGEVAWVEVKSPHFTVFTDAGEKRGREVATRFEQMRAVFGELMTQAKVNTPIPLQIVAFRNNKELKQVSPLWNGKPIELAGLFIPGSDRCFILLDMATENPWSTVFHEYAHQLMNGTLSMNLDPWFEEGFAEYFSSIEVNSHHANVGKIPAMTYEIIRQQGMMKVSDLFKVQHDSATYNESGDKRTVFYAESAMVVHYLYDNNLIPKLVQYFDLRYNKKVSVEEAIQQAFGMSAANFHKAIVQYVASNQFLYYPKQTPPEVETTGYTSRPVSATDAAAVIADLHAHSRDYQEKAFSEFEQILKSDPGNAAACRGMGYVYLQKHDLEKAAEYFQRAAKSDPKDARVRYYSGLLTNMKGSGSEAELSFATDELKAAVELDPDFADAYMQLAYVQGRAGDLNSALASARKAISLNPGNPGYYFNVANLYLQDRKTAEALSIYRALSKSSDPRIASQAENMAEQAERMQMALKDANTQQFVAPGRATLVERGPQINTAPAPPASNTPMVNSPIKFLKGKIVQTDCSSAPAATLTIMSSGKKWTMQVRDSKHVLVLGADGFNCGWQGQSIALNYRDTGDLSGTVVSIEIQ